MILSYVNYIILILNIHHFLFIQILYWFLVCNVEISYLFNENENDVLLLQNFEPGYTAPIKKVRLLDAGVTIRYFQLSSYIYKYNYNYHICSVFTETISLNMHRILSCHVFIEIYCFVWWVCSLTLSRKPYLTHSFRIIRYVFQGLKFYFTKPL